MESHWLVVGSCPSGQSTGSPAGVASETAAHGRSGDQGRTFRLTPDKTADVDRIAVDKIRVWLASQQTHPFGEVALLGEQHEGELWGSGRPWGRLLARSLKEETGESVGPTRPSRCWRSIAVPAFPTLSTLQRLQLIMTEARCASNPWKTPRSKGRDDRSAGSRAPSRPRESAGDFVS